LKKEGSISSVGLPCRTVRVPCRIWSQESSYFVGSRFLISLLSSCFYRVSPPSSSDGLAFISDSTMRPPVPESRGGCPTVQEPRFSRTAFRSPLSWSLVGYYLWSLFLLFFAFDYPFLLAGFPPGLCTLYAPRGLAVLGLPFSSPNCPAPLLSFVLLKSASPPLCTAPHYGVYSAPTFPSPPFPPLPLLRATTEIPGLILSGLFLRPTFGSFPFFSLQSPAATVSPSPLFSVRFPGRGVASLPPNFEETASSLLAWKSLPNWFSVL